MTSDVVNAIGKISELGSDLLGIGKNYYERRARLGEYNAMVRVDTEINRLISAHMDTLNKVYKDASDMQLFFDVASVFIGNFHVTQLAQSHGELGRKIGAIPLIGCPKDFAVAVSDFGAALVEYSNCYRMSKAEDQEWGRKLLQLEHRLRQIMAPSEAEFSEPEHDSLLSNIYHCMFICTVLAITITLGIIGGAIQFFVVAGAIGSAWSGIESIAAIGFLAVVILFCFYCVIGLVAGIWSVHYLCGYDIDEFMGIMQRVVLIPVVPCLLAVVGYISLMCSYLCTYWIRVSYFGYEMLGTSGQWGATGVLVGLVLAVYYQFQVLADIKAAKRARLHVHGILHGGR